MRVALLAWDYPPAPSGLSTAAREIVGFGSMIVVLLVFPQGLFGKREIFKV